MPCASFVSLNNPLFTACCESISGAAASPGESAPPGLAKNCVSLLPWKRGGGPQREERGQPLFPQSSALPQLPSERRRDQKGPRALPAGLGPWDAGPSAEMSRIPNDVKVCGSFSHSAFFPSPYPNTCTLLVSKVAF